MQARQGIHTLWAWPVSMENAQISKFSGHRTISRHRVPFPAGRGGGHVACRARSGKIHQADLGALERVPQEDAAGADEAQHVVRGQEAAGTGAVFPAQQAQLA